ncbi:hypothetical protein A2926_01835 [Candidatus Giovannonibacteria bacterium RIFCSPLOWO2_01_FULL_44_40]|uniref:Uncharacterized protein n=1 Tax=Candidatus Giovannonibacteria bacterium RIFCSPHIGHO2_01_FULL_45_23 TaxID=1798325 RepID=A0A1F5VJ62_9BACT|nr:MAG: hypothetical protein A2834_01480 [Candidatus Giovannonibacteria bacterium RIFCSPHIGHO2_01_FULL_45_23]OGF76818.1 MAG: hypothetical protein A3C77_00250 [Candidatus Giovannonibacteria bacterium RIFCSPHIGHO2_02_FULL_45_13]OGF79742.1 MAG: hypothetical protein A2926_01835 [Candidatus Giovannonibacteria bacterium RIFCSPLOWO2_01_FULL_44_40]
MLIKKSVLYCLSLIGHAVFTVITAAGVSSTFWWLINGKALFGLSTALIMTWVGIGGIMLFFAIFKNRIREGGER